LAAASPSIEATLRVERGGLCHVVPPGGGCDCAGHREVIDGERRWVNSRALIDAGLEPTAGTDVTGIYLANLDPFLAIYAAVTRESDMGVFESAQATAGD
jgi:predicted amidohydrolase YtcJ